MSSDMLEKVLEFIKQQEDEALGPSVNETISAIKETGVDPLEWGINYDGMSFSQRRGVIRIAQEKKILCSRGYES